MRLLIALASLVLGLVACRDHSVGGNRQDIGSTAKPAPEPQIVVADAAVTAPTPAPGSNVDPATGDDVTTRAVQPNPNHPGHPIDVTLRSTPAGARVAVDGAVIGNTPAYWNAMADGHEHEFVFTLRGYAIARYRFVPISSGVIHPRLEPISEDVDAGVAPVEVVPHPHAPGMVAPPASPNASPNAPGIGPQP